MPNRAALLDRHLSAIERSEARAVRRVAAAYRRARAELVTQLIDQWPGQVATPEQAAQALRSMALVQQIDGRLLELEQEIGIILRDVVSAGSEQALAQIERELALLPAAIRPANIPSFAMLHTRMIEQFLPVALDGAQLGTRALSLQLSRELQMGVIQGQSFPDLVRRLMAATPSGTTPAVWARGEVSATLATRRAVITAENGAKQAALGEVQAAIPEVRKQAVAAMGPTTTETCLRVHGQIQPVGEPFQLSGTPRFADAMQYPAFHWNCRTAVAMWHPSFEQGNATTENMRARAAAELRKR